jgi:hypothetical protein
MVEILAFSGRPDPVVDIGAAAEAELAARLARLPPDSRRFEPADRLGYRGLRVRPRGSAGATIELSEGRVRVADPAGRRTSDLADPGRECERWLLERARASGDADVRALVDAIIRSEMDQR